MKIIKSTIMLCMLLLAFTTTAQVGVGNTDPKATLDITGSPATAEAVDGIIVPRLTADQLAAKTGYGVDQNGTLVYVTAAPAAALTGEFVNITEAGIYVYSHDGSTGIWTAVGASSSNFETATFNGSAGQSLLLSDGSSRPDESVFFVREDGQLTSAGIQVRKAYFPGIGMTSYNSINANSSPVIDFKRGRGSFDAPEQTLAGDRLGRIRFLGARANGGLDVNAYINVSAREDIVDYDSEMLYQLWISNRIAYATNGSNTTIGSGTLDTSAILRLDGTGGFLPPRLTQAELTSLTGSPEGLMFYCTDCNPKGLYFANETGAFISSTNTSGNTVPLGSVIVDFASTATGQTLTAVSTYSENGAGAATSTTYQWYRADDLAGTNETEIVGATNATYTLVAADEEKFVYVVYSATATNGESVTITSDFIPTVFTFNGLTYIPIRGDYDGNSDGIGDYIWLDRNLGASQVATSFNDANAYGDMYQKNRGTDGHELRTSSLYNLSTEPLITTGEPNTGAAWDGLFIHGGSSLDWSNGNFIAWSTDVNGTTNPCPGSKSFIVPSGNNYNLERTTWVSNDRFGAFSSALKLTAGGRRGFSFGNIGGQGLYHVRDSSRSFRTQSNNAVVYDSSSEGTRQGNSVRCIYQSN